MKKIENFSKCLNILKNADFNLADKNEIYRTGIISQFSITFELSWKALQYILRLYGVREADSGSPREILQLAYKFNFVNNPEIWLLMLKKRNIISHVYSENEVKELVFLIRDKFIHAFTELEKTLQTKLQEINF